MGEDYGEKQKAALWAQARKLTGGVRFAGATGYSRLLEVLRSEADVFVHPSVEEAFSLATAEAMALGIPVIAGAGSGGVRSTVDRGAAGMLVDVRSPNKLAAAILDLMTQPQRRVQLGSAGREFALRRFRIEGVADRYEQAYLEAINTCGSSTPWAN